MVGYICQFCEGTNGDSVINEIDNFIDHLHREHIMGRDKTPRRIPLDVKKVMKSMNKIVAMRDTRCVACICSAEQK